MPWEKQFDRDTVLGLAEQTFWDNGYQGTSLEMLLENMGIQKGSFYATFGSKHDVLLESLHRYIQERFATFEQVAQKHPPLKALAQHLDVVVRECRGERAEAGCFLVNAALELSPTDEAVRDLVRQTLRNQELFYTKLLETARERGELKPDFDTVGTARALLGFVLGMRVMARIGLPLTTIRAVRDQAIALFQNSMAEM